jgi:hypothetical protein
VASLSTLVRMIDRDVLLACVAARLLALVWLA